MFGIWSESIRSGSIPCRPRHTQLFTRLLDISNTERLNSPRKRAEEISLSSFTFLEYPGQAVDLFVGRSLAVGYRLASAACPSSNRDRICYCRITGTREARPRSLLKAYKVETPAEIMTHQGRLQPCSSATWFLAIAHVSVLPRPLAVGRWTCRVCNHKAYH